MDSGEELLSFTMLTVNADDHELVKQFLKPGDERRMVVILHEHQYNERLTATPAKSMEFIQQYPAHLLVSAPDRDRGKEKG